MSRLSRGAGKRVRSAKVPSGVHANEHGLFFGLLKRESLPLPETEFQFAADRRWRFDFCWAKEGVAVEVEGGIWQRGGGRHNRGAGMLKDMEKYNEAAVRGWKVLRVTPQQLCTLTTVALIKRALTEL